MVAQLSPSSHSGSRDQALALVTDLPEDLSGCTVVLDCSEMFMATPSFADEIVKQVLVIRKGRSLDVVDASPRVWTLIKRASLNRGVGERLHVVSPA